MNSVTKGFLTMSLLLTTLGATHAVLAAGELGEIVDADHRRVEVDGSLAKEVDRLRESVRGPAWLTWTVPIADGRHSMCCYRNWRDAGNGGGMCRLEGRNRNFGHTTDDDWVTDDADLRVLVRLENGKLDDLRAVTTDCALDVGGLPFYTLDGVAPRQSVAWLEGIVLEKDGARLARNRDRAIMALALHDDGSADRALVTLTGRRAPADVREDAVFWLGAARGDAGLDRLLELLDDDPDRDVQEKVVFALSISDADGAVDALIGAARSHRSSEIREKALFWLGQEAGERAVATLRRAVDDDPNAEVREAAVFAVSQLPRDEAVPMLIELAKTNKHAEVRKQAMFWLGQTGDSRALELFEAILTD